MGWEDRIEFELNYDNYLFITCGECNEIYLYNPVLTNTRPSYLLCSERIIAGEESTFISPNTATTAKCP